MHIAAAIKVNLIQLESALGAASDAVSYIWLVLLRFICQVSNFPEFEVDYRGFYNSTNLN